MQHFLTHNKEIIEHPKHQHPNAEVEKQEIHLINIHTPKVLPNLAVIGQETRSYDDQPVVKVQHRYVNEEAAPHRPHVQLIVVHNQDSDDLVR